MLSDEPETTDGVDELSRLDTAEEGVVISEQLGPMST